MMVYYVLLRKGSRCIRETVVSDIYEARKIANRWNLESKKVTAYILPLNESVVGSILEMKGGD